MSTNIHSAQKSWDGGAIADHVTSRHVTPEVSVVMQSGYVAGGDQPTSAITSPLTSGATA
jgi:hypothetical protein